MRHVVTRRKTRILGVLFFASAALFYQEYANVMLKEFAEKRMEILLPEGSHVAIGKIEGGIFRDLVSENVNIFSEDNATNLNIERVEINYRLWYPVAKKIPYLLKHLGTKEGKKLDIAGQINFANKDKLMVNGFVAKGEPSHIRIAQDKGYIDLDIIERNKGDFAIDALVNHMKIRNIDVIAKCVAYVNIGEKGNINANLTFKDIIVDYIPFSKKLEILLYYDKGKKLLDITEFKINEEIKGSGAVRFASPGYLSLKWNVTNLALSDYFNAMTVGENVSGTMNGNFSLEGFVQEPAFSAHLDIQKGNFGTIMFNSVIGTLKGKGPVISIVDSRLITENGNFEIGGSIDLSGSKDKDAFSGITFKPEDNFFIWEGWSVKKETKDASVKAEKLVKEDIKVSFKARRENKESEEEHLVSVERKVKF